MGKSEKPNQYNYISIVKSISPQAKGIALWLRNFASVLDVKQKGVFIKLDDGSFIRLPDAELDVAVSSANSWQYDTFIIMPTEMQKRIIEHKIVSYNFAFSGDISLSEESRKEISNQIVCAQSL